jgi:hypothetical protein
MKITVQMISIIQCRKCCSCAMRVTAGCRLSWLTAGPPGRSAAACAKEPPPATLIIKPQGTSLVEMLFIVFTYI